MAFWPSSGMVFAETGSSLGGRGGRKPQLLPAILDSRGRHAHKIKYNRSKQKQTQICDKSAEKFRMTGYELTGLAAQSCLEFIDADKPMKEDITIGTNTSIE